MDMTKTLPGKTYPLSVRGVTLESDDSPQVRRQKLARVVLNDMYQFAGLLDVDGLPLDINQSALDGAGIRLEDIQSKPFWQARWWEASAEAQAFAYDCVQKARSGAFAQGDIEVFGANAGRDKIIIDFSLLPIRDASGQIVFLLAEGRNVSMKKRVEAQLAAKNLELQNLLSQIEHLSQLKSEFFANVSHELRTPLALVLGPVESLLNHGEGLTPRQRHDLEIVHRNAATLLKYVNDLLDLAKFDAGKVGLHVSAVDAAHLLRGVCGHFEALALQQSIRFEVQAPPSLPAELDTDKFERVLLNLLSNAFKPTPAGGSIRCCIEALALQRVLRVLVQDSGPGIDPQMRSAVFERFGQGTGASGQAFSGTGLGLAIVKDFVELHGGSIALGGAAEGGASFEIRLPWNPTSEELALPPASMPLSWLQRGSVDATLHVAWQNTESEAEFGPPDGASVLIAEDNAEMRHFMAHVLGDRYRLRMARDGQQALRMALQQPPDLLLTDLMMPGLEGDQLIQAMRAQPALAQVPVIVLSAKADEALRLKLLSESVQDYVVKPFSPDELHARVNNLVMLKKARDALQGELLSQNQDVSALTQQLIANKQELQRSFEVQRASQQLWRAVYQHSAAGIALTDLDGHILEANAAFQAMLGYDEQALHGKTIGELTPDDEQAEAEGRLRQLLQGRVSEYHVERRYKRRDEGVIWATASVSLIPGSGQRAPMLMRIVEDITERRHAELRLQESQRELARVTRATALGELAASIAHEVNQPLAGVVANAHAGLRWLASEPPNHSEVRDAVQRIVRDANRASDVVTRIRGFLRRGQQQRQTVYMGEVVREVASFVREKARADGVELQVDVSEPCPGVLADRIQLQQVLLNLAMNGIEATRVVKDRPRVIRLSASPQSLSTLLVSVRDTGIGLDQALRERIFDAFFTSKPDGLGMGLSISHSIVENHGGRLWAVSNKDGPGATFHFTMPLDGASAS